MKCGLQVTGDPEKVEPPNGIGEELAHCECPSFLARDHVTPGNALDFLAGITEDQCEFGFGDAGLILGPAIDNEPENKPNEAQCASDEE